MTQDFATKIKQLRTNKCLTQQQLADRINSTRSTISNYELGKRTPHLRDLQKLASVLGVGLDYFGISATDEAFDLLQRAKDVFNSPLVDKKTKEELYTEFMKLYLDLKGEE